MSVELDSVTFSYPEQGKRGSSALILDGFSARFEPGMITAILGASGCGKSTLLSCIAGLRRPATGRINALAGDGVPSMIFQEPRLVPWLTVTENCDLTLKTCVPKRRDRRELAAEALRAVGLAEMAERYPDQLSGGQLQRAGMARAFAYPADLLLMDEPFQGLDVMLRMELMDIFLKLWRKRRQTVIAVTHDPWEAARMADRCLVLKGPPLALAADIAIPEPRSDREGPVAAAEAAIFRGLTAAHP